MTASLRLSGLVRALACAASVLCLASGASAQSAPSTAPPTAEASDAFGEVHRETIDELDGHRRVPPQGTRAAQLIRGERAAAVMALGEADDRDLAVAAAFSWITTAAMGASYDRALENHGFGSSSPMLGIDVALSHHVLPWLAFGVRLDMRGKAWTTRQLTLAMASGSSLLGFAAAHFQIGRLIDMGVEVGGGLGLGGTSLGGALNVGLAPRIGGHLRLAMRFDRGLRLLVRAGYDYFMVQNVDRLGYDVDLGGPGATIGLEFRS